jgi:hypothetical protein
MNLAAVCLLAVAGASSCGAPAAGAMDAYVNVAQRIYSSERDGSSARASLRRISHDAAAMRGSRAELLRQLFLPAFHVVRLRVARHGRVTNVGGKFVVAGPSVDGLTISIQDVLGYVKLVSRLTGQGVIVRGRPGHVVSSSPAFLKARLPASGAVSVGGQEYQVRSFSERGFAGEPLRIWILSGSSSGA